MTMNSGVLDVPLPTPHQQSQVYFGEGFWWWWLGIRWAEPTLWHPDAHGHAPLTQAPIIMSEAGAGLQGSMHTDQTPASLGQSARPTPILSNVSQQGEKANIEQTQ